MIQITEVPFARTIGLEKTAAGLLRLCFDASVMNHVETVAAAAQYSLAELASGEHLLQLCADLVDEAVPLLRDSRLKFKHPASSVITAYPATIDRAVTRFRRQYAERGRGLLDIDVDVKDAEGMVTSTGRFRWFVRRR